MQNRSKIQFLGIILIIGTFFFSVSCVKIQTQPQENEAVFNFAKNFNNQSIYEFRGKWQFVPDTLLTPEEFQNFSGKKYFVQVPSTWTKYNIEGKNLSNIGYGTFQTKFIVPHKGIYSIKFKRIFLSANIFVNKNLILSIGKVSTDPKEYKPSRLTKEVILNLDRDTNILTIQVANFSHKKAGILRSPKFGTVNAIKKFVYETIFYDGFIAGSLVFMMFFFFVLYFYNKSNISNLYFSIFLLVALIVIIFDRELLFYRVFPEFSWILAMKIYYLAFIWRAYMFILLIDSISKGLIHKNIKKFSLWFSAIMSAFVLFTPMKIYTHSLAILILFTMISIIYEIIVVGLNLKKEKYLHFAFWGLLIILISGVNDALFEYKVIKTFYSSGIAIFIFTLLQGIEISIRNANILNTEEMLNNKFRIQNSLKISLLNTPSYDLPQVLRSLNENLNIDKILLFTVENNRIALSITATKEDIKESNKNIDFNQTYSDFDIHLLKYAYDNKIPVSTTEFKNKIQTTSKSGSSLILPLINDDRVIAIVYFENTSKKMTKALIEVLSSAQTLFNSLIHTAVIYFNLEKLNYELDEKVKERTQEVQKQKAELKEKNEQLDEKIQLLEEQYTIQSELNKAMEAHNEEIERENELLKEQNEFIKKQNEKINKHTRLIKSDIYFADKILSITQKNDDLTDFNESFHLDIPKNIISGDFLFAKKINNLWYIALGDATGHGVPGALMRTFAYKTLEALIRKHDEYRTQPNEILNLLREQIKKNFSSEQQELNEGLDITFTVIDLQNSKLYFSGAYNSLLFIRNGKMTIIKADRMPIGRYIEEHEKSFTTKELEIEKNDIFYYLTDGFADQFGGPNNEKYFSSNLRNLLTKISIHPFNFQKDILKKEFYDWKGNNMQIDDISIVGLKI